MNSLRNKYTNEVVSSFKKEYSLSSVMQVARIEKVVLNMGLGAAVSNPKLIDIAVTEMRSISGQSPVIKKAKKAISNFKLREGAPIGVMVTLRKERMWHFLDRLVFFVLPRVRDFKGISKKSFDGRGNYTLGIREQIVFPEIDYDKVDQSRGMNISIVTTADDDSTAFFLLRSLGFPFS